ncbi:MAG: DUF5906 domain-containing protein [Planctomycetes bacterium]|nr:DUF5906 domain-containing protein [Planctomycetota bacterium]
MDSIVHFSGVVSTNSEVGTDPDDSTTYTHPNEPPGAIEELGELDQWVTWSPALRDGKTTKPPVDPHTGRYASAQDPSTWGSYGDAGAAAKGSGRVGFVFTADDPYCGIDLDDVLDEKQRLLPWAEEIVRKVNSYTEISPSGKGVKIFCRGAVPGASNRKGDIEMYDTGRYFTVTQHHLSGYFTPNDITDAQAAINWVHEKFIAAAPAKPAAISTPAIAQPSVTEADAEVLRRCRTAANHAKFDKLWAGDISAYGDDDSRADSALCCLIAFYTGEAAQIERIFSGSALAKRVKWQERVDYRKRTIVNALSTVTERARPAAITSVSDTVTGETQDEEPAPACTDIGNADRFIQQHGQRLLYCEAMGAWLHYDGKIWVEDRVRKVDHLAKQTARSIHHEAAQADDLKQQSEVAKWAMTSQSEMHVTAMLKLARCELPVTPQQLDCEPFLLAVQNGILDLKTGDLLPHDPRHLITKISPATYRADAVCPLYDKFVGEIMQGKPELIEYLDRLCGWFLTGDISHQILPIFFGQGCNGKSTLIDLIIHLMGAHATNAAESLLTVSFGNAHPTELADLQGRRLVVASETEEGNKLKTGLVKRLTGDQTIKARRMRQDFFEFQRTHKMVLVTNNRPRIPENTPAMWRRLKLIPFLAHFDKPDTSMLEKLKEEVDGILARFVRACLRWQKDGKDLREPVIVGQATDEYREDENPLREFLEQRCVYAAEARVSREEIQAAYMQRCESQSVKYPLSERSLYERLRHIPGVHDGKVKLAGLTVRVFEGIGLKSNTFVRPPAQGGHAAA